MNDVTQEKLNDAISTIASFVWQDRISDLLCMSQEQMRQLPWTIQTSRFAVFEVASCDDNVLYNPMQDTLKAALFCKMSGDGMMLLAYMIEKGVIHGASIDIGGDGNSIPMANIQFSFPSASDLRMNEDDHQTLMRLTLLTFIRMGIRDEWLSLQDRFSSAISAFAYSRDDNPIQEVVRNLH